MLDKILVAFDNSSHAREALKQAASLAEGFSSSISLIYVIKPTSVVAAMPIEGGIAPVDVLQEKERAEKEAKELIEEGKRMVKAKGKRIKGLIVEGDPAEKIVSAAREGDYDLIVMGARGLGRIKSILLGSVSSGVVQKADRPILIVKQPVRG